jgi:hypothetical protein
MKSFFYFLFLFLNIYQFNYGGLYIAIVFNVLFMSYFLFKKDFKLNIGKIEINTIVFVLIIIFWSAITLILSNKADIIFLMGRNFRLLISTIFIAFLNRYFLDDKIDFLKILNLVLITHSTIALLQFVVPSLKPFFASIVGYEKTILDLRSFGLVNGYDGAGLFALFSLWCSFDLFIKRRKNIYFIFILIGSAACFLTSRTTMVFALLSLFLLFLLNIQYILKLKYAIPFFVFFALLYQVLLYILPILVISFPILKDFLPSTMTSAGGISIQSSYAAQSVEWLINDMIFYPKLGDFIFGTGYNPIKTDIGYIKILFLYGAGGLIIILTLFTYLFLSSMHSLSVVKGFNKDLRMLIIVVFIFILAYNFKLQLLFARSFYELYILIVFSIHIITKSTKSNANEISLCNDELQ